MDIQQLIEKAREARLMEDELQAEKEKPISLSDAKFCLDYWKILYCKGSQPHNYIRITRIIPLIEGVEAPRFFWKQKIQAWVKGEIEREEIICDQTYDFLKDLSSAEWSDPVQNGQQESCTYRHPKFRNK